jgi:polyhydroxyalkanoate synthesis regulator protein
MIRDGKTVEIADAQTGDDITRPVPIQLIAERHPERIEIFRVAMLQSIWRANR